MSLRFENVTVDFESRTIASGGRVLPLSPKAFDLLRLLIERRPAVVSFTELRAQLWPASHVGRSSLPALIAEIRGMLNESAQPGGTIRTVHRVGYAFAAHAIDATETTPANVHVAWLVVPERRVPLTSGSHLLGREGEGIVAFPETTVSRRHARLVITDTSATLEDLGSKNGTWVNGRRVAAATPLEDGGAFMLGTLRIEFTRSREGGATKTAPELDQRERRVRNKSPRTRFTT